jgi:hypothetical protein
MRTSTYTDFLKRVSALMGQPYADLLDEEEAMLREFFNRHMRFAWDSFMWPEICLIEERTPDANNRTSLTEASETEIAEVFNCWRDDPHDTAYPREVAYLITENGIQFLEGQTYDPTYIFFRKRKPEFTGDDYAAATAYVADDQVLYLGRFYKCILASTGNLPTNATYWEELEIPYVFLEYAVAGAYGDWLVADGQVDKAAMALASAGEILVMEIDKAQRQQQQQPRVNTFRTHGTTQSR